MSSLVLALGSNLGSRLENLQLSYKKLCELYGKPISSSCVYETPPWGNENQTNFYNACIEFPAPLKKDPFQVLKECLEIEKEMGRVRKEKWGARTIDIDILFFEDKKINTKSLTVPHPEIFNRNFVLIPLLELSYSKKHLILDKIDKKINFSNSKKVAELLK